MRKIISAIYLLSFFSLINSISAQVTFTASSPTAECSDASFCVQISVSNFDSITSFQYVYDWDTTVMKLIPGGFTDLMPSGIGTDPEDPLLADSIASGRAPYSWVDLSFPIIGVSLVDGVDIAELCFEPNNLGTSDVDFDGNTTTIQTVSGVVNGSPTPDIPASYVSGTSTVEDSEDPVITCPANQSIPSNGTNVMGIAPTSSSDNCGIASITYNMVMGGMNVGSGVDDASGEFFDLGTTTVTYTITDDSGNTSDCSFDVTLTPPPPGAGSLQFIPEINYDCDAGTVSIDMLVTNFDSITGIQFGLQWDTTSIAYVGSTNNLPAAATYNQVSDSTLLFLWFPFSGNPLTLTDSTVIFTLDFTVNGSLSLPVLQFISFPGIPIGAGQIQNGVDVNLAPGVDFFLMPEIINVIDNIGPMISNCPANISVSTDPGLCTANVSWTAPTITDNCGIDTTIVSGMPGIFPIGIDTISYIVTDIGGNSDTCSFTITVEDNENPTITCPANISENVIAGTCSNNTINLGTPTTADNCGVASVTNNAPATYSVGTTTVTWTVTDDNNNTATCDQTVTITDNENPTITCPANITQCPGGTVTLGTPTTSDNCGVASVTNNAPATFSVGTTTVTWTVTDDNNNTATCDQTVTIEDNENPTITCPANITQCPGGTVTLGTPTTSDNCGVASVTNNAPATFSVGTTTVTWTVTDDNNNTATCDQTVTIEDNQDPTITCPANITQCPGGTVTLGTPITNDNCGVASVTNNAPATFPIGMTTVTWTVTDDNNNTATCDQIVTIEDNQLPTITCPLTDAIDATAGQCSAAYTNSLTPTVNDNCDNDLTVTYAITGATSNTGNDDATNEVFNVGMNTLTYYVMDDAGNIDSCSVTVQVNDNQLPTLSCPLSQSIFVPTGTVDTVVNGIGLVSSADNCGIASTTFGFDGTLTGPGTGNDASGTAFPVGNTTVTYYVTDDNGNIDSCNFIISVQEVANNLIGCPPNQVQPNDTDSCNAVVNGINPILLVAAGDIATITWSSTGATILSGNNDASGQIFNVGTTTIEYIATDLFGTMDTCSFDVDVFDSQLPDWANCPTTINANITPGGCTATVSWTVPTASDNCGINQIVPSHMPGAIFSIGTTEVSYVAIDDAGNVATCSFDVVVTDNIPPSTSDCPMDITMASNLPDCEAIVNWTVPTFTDCSSPISVTCTHEPGDTFPVGTTTVICIAVDAAGNSATCSFDVTIQDNSAPMVTCPTDITVNSLAKDCGAFVNWPLPTATDDCDNSVSISQVPPPGTFFPVGTTTVTVSATDDSGNIGTCMFDVIVNDVIAPQFTCPTEEIVISIDGTVLFDDLGLINTTGANANCDSLFINYNIPTVTDNCAVMTTNLNMGIASGGAFPLGTTVIEYIAFDDAGNFSTCSFEIEVLPLDPVGVAIQPSDNICEGIDIQLITNVGSPGATFSWSGPDGFMSNLDSPTIDDVTLINAGFYSVTVTFASGCTATGTDELTVNEADPVTASSNSPICIDGDIELMVTGPMDADYSWTGPDNFTSDLQNPVITDPTNANSGPYTVTVEYPNGCIATSSTNVSFTNLATPEIDLDCETDICLGTTCLLTGTDYSPIPEFYNWTATPTTGAGLPANTNDNQISVTPTAPGTYIYSYSVELNGCESVQASQAVIVHGAPDAVDDSFDIVYETEQEVFVTQNDSFNTNIGINVNIVTQTANGTVELTGDGRFTYTPNSGFIGTDQFIYEICYDCGPLLCDNALVTLTVSDNGDCELPTVITPNKDGVNDELFINCLETGNFPNNEIIIYNQWGDEVFTAAPYQNNWEGTHDGKDLPDGTYYIVFRLDDNADLIKQYITIFR